MIEENTSLGQLGLARDHIYETILSTYNADGTPTAAPMGIVPKRSGIFLVRIFKGTLTLNNLRRTRCGVVNFTTDPDVFYRTTFKRLSDPRSFRVRKFEKAITVKAPRLRVADANIEFRVKDIKDLDDLRCGVVCCAERIDSRRTLPSGYCRGKFAAIECIIHATRIRQYLCEDKVRDAKKLIALIYYYRDLAERVSPDSRYTSVIRRICSKIDTWRRSNARLR